MTNEERDLITAFIARVSGAAPAPAAAGPWGSPSVPATAAPATAAPPLPPIDPEADALIGTMFQRYPEARYRLAQLAFVQQHALAAAQNRIQQLEAQVSQPPPAQPHGGFFSGLFGGARPAPAPGPMPPPGYPPAAPGGYPPGMTPGMAPGGMLPRSGTGFLGSALTTAAGVAGGMLLGNALMNMVSPGQASAGSALPPDTSSDALWGTPTDPAEPAGLGAPDPSPAADGWTDPGDGGWDPGGGSDDTLV